MAAGRGLPESSSFPDGQGNQVTVRRQVKDNVAAVGLDGIEEGGLVEPVPGHDMRLRFYQNPNGLQVAQPGSMDEWGAAVAILRINRSAMLEQAGDTLSSFGIQRGRRGAEQFEQRWQAIGARGIYVSPLRDGRPEQRQISLSNCPRELLAGRR